jgi:hypothetical protein
MRALYLGFNVIIDEAGNAVPNAPFDVFDDAVAGSRITDMRLINGETVPTVNEGGQFLALASGIPPHLRGPDGYEGRLYRDTGSGQREPMEPDERLDALLQTALTQVSIDALNEAVAAAAAEGTTAQNMVLTLAVRSVNGQGPDATGNVTVVGGTGGLDITSLETRLGGPTGATSQLIPKLLMPYGRVNGVWPIRPSWGGQRAMAVGTAPGPTDLLSGDIYVEVAL